MPRNGDSQKVLFLEHSWCSQKSSIKYHVSRCQWTCIPIFRPFGGLNHEKSWFWQGVMIFMWTLKILTKVCSSGFSTINATRSGYSGHAPPMVYLKGTRRRSGALNTEPFSFETRPWSQNHQNHHNWSQITKTTQNHRKCMRKSLWRLQRMETPLPVTQPPLAANLARCDTLFGAANLVWHFDPKICHKPPKGPTIMGIRVL